MYAVTFFTFFYFNIRDLINWKSYEFRRRHWKYHVWNLCIHLISHWKSSALNWTNFLNLFYVIMILREIACIECIAFSMVHHRLYFYGILKVKMSKFLKPTNFYPKSFSLTFELIITHIQSFQHQSEMNRLHHQIIVCEKKSI